tara:strand:+ start:52 stop:456 length:405 start_codon:yes stop_codon:yes gene_type:complete
MRESTFIRAVHQHVDRAKCVVWKINDNYFGGIPDCWYLGPNGQPFFIEYKWIKALPKRLSTPIKPNLSQLQLQMCSKLERNGHLLFVVVGVEIERKVIIYRDSQTWTKGIDRNSIELLSRKDFSNFLEYQLMEG